MDDMAGASQVHYHNLNPNVPVSGPESPSAGQQPRRRRVRLFANILLSEFFIDASFLGESD
jgi:hypothetical protein